MSDQKSTWSSLTSECRDGTSDDQKKKFNGVITKANIDENPVSATARATFPRACSEKKLETLPPGHDDTMINPRPTPWLTGNSVTTMTVTSGNNTYCPSKPVMTAFRCESNCVKCSRLISRAVLSMMKARQMFIKLMLPSEKLMLGVSGCKGGNFFGMKK